MIFPLLSGFLLPNLTFGLIYDAKKVVHENKLCCPKRKRISAVVVILFLSKMTVESEYVSDLSIFVCTPSNSKLLPTCQVKSLKCAEKYLFRAGGRASLPKFLDHLIKPKAARRIPLLVTKRGSNIIPDMIFDPRPRPSNCG